MSAAMMHPLLADGGLFGDAQTWVIILIAVASAVGGLLKKRSQKGGSPDKAGDPQGPAGRPPTPPRPPRVSVPRPPQRPVATTAARPVATQPPRRRSPAEPYRLEELRAAAQRARESMAAPLPSERDTLLAAEGEAEEPAPLDALAKSKLESAEAVARPIRRRAACGVVQTRLRRMLQVRPGLQTAVVLAEILGRPVALREDHPQ